MGMKQVILVRMDLKLPKGKLGAQTAHASTEAMLKADTDNINEWRSEGAKKVVLKVADEKELLRFFQDAKDAGLKPSLITDAGKTVIAPGTKTCVGIGPHEEKTIDEITGDLKML